MLWRKHIILDEILGLILGQYSSLLLTSGLDTLSSEVLTIVIWSNWLFYHFFEPAKAPFWADSWRCDCAANIKPKKQNLESLFCYLQALPSKASKELQPERHQSKELSISLETFVSGFRLFSSNRELFYDFYGWNLESKVIQQRRKEPNNPEHRFWCDSNINTFWDQNVTEAFLFMEYVFSDHQESRKSSRPRRPATCSALWEECEVALGGFQGFQRNQRSTHDPKEVWKFNFRQYGQLKSRAEK